MFGVMFAIAATSAGLTPLETIAMSALVFTASAQFASLEIWNHPGALGTILVASALISSRHVLLALALVNHIKERSVWERILSMWMLTDPNAITTIRLSRQGEAGAVSDPISNAAKDQTGLEDSPASQPEVSDPRPSPPAVNRLVYFLGGGAILYVAWMVGTALGLTFTNAFSNDQMQALRFSGVLVLATMMVLFVRGNTASAVPWIGSGLAAAALTWLGVHAHLIMPLSVVAGLVVFLLQPNARGEPGG